MKNFFKKHLLIILLSLIALAVVIVAIALMTKAIDLPTSISIFAALIAVAILMISINEIRNRLRPWVALASIDQELTRHPNIFYAYFNIINTGPIPATKVIYNVQWYIQENSRWKKIAIKGESPFKSTQQMLFPNQSIRHRSGMHNVITAAPDKDTKATFTIEYHGLWSKHATVNTHRFDYKKKVWIPDEPQDYT
jgi:hypothetical protein